MAQAEKAFKGCEYRVESRIENIGPRNLDEYEFTVKLVHQKCNKVVDRFTSNTISAQTVPEVIKHLTKQQCVTMVNGIKRQVKTGVRVFFKTRNCARCGGPKNEKT